MCVCVQGARGSGGVRLLYSPEEVELAAKEMIGDFLITKQTGAEGRSGIVCRMLSLLEIFTRFPHINKNSLCK